MRLRDELLRYSDNKKICIAFLRDKANPLVKGNHLIRAIERNLVAIQSFTQFYKSLNNPEIQTKLVSTMAYILSPAYKRPKDFPR